MCGKRFRITLFSTLNRSSGSVHERRRLNRQASNVLVTQQISSMEGAVERTRLTRDINIIKLQKLKIALQCEKPFGAPQDLDCWYHLHEPSLKMFSNELRALSARMNLAFSALRSDQTKHPAHNWHSSWTGQQQKALLKCIYQWPLAFFSHAYL